MTVRNFRQNLTTSKLDKIKRLATDPAATNGERQAAAEALRRNDIPLDIELSDSPPPALNAITLMPIAIAIYAHLYEGTAANEWHKEMVTEEIEIWLGDNSLGSTEALAAAFEETLRNKVYKIERHFCALAGGGEK